MKVGSRISEIQGKHKTRKQAFKHVERSLNSADQVLRTNAVDSERMGRIRQRDTKPEVAVRRVASSLGYRYRTKNKDLPGSPDLANRKRRWAIFVHGCYWHAHEGCPKATVPRKNREFWLAKFRRNKERDRQARHLLRKAGYKVVVIWECETTDRDRVVQSLLSLF